MAQYGWVWLSMARYGSVWRGGGWVGWASLACKGCVILGGHGPLANFSGCNQSKSAEQRTPHHATRHAVKLCKTVRMLSTTDARDASFLHAPEQHAAFQESLRTLYKPELGIARAFSVHCETGVIRHPPNYPRAHNSCFWNCTASQTKQPRRDDIF